MIYENKAELARINNECKEFQMMLPSEIERLDHVMKIQFQQLQNDFRHCK